MEGVINRNIEFDYIFEGKFETRRLRQFDYVFKGKFETRRLRLAEVIFLIGGWRQLNNNGILAIETNNLENKLGQKERPEVGKISISANMFGEILQLQENSGKVQ